MKEVKSKFIAKKILITTMLAIVTVSAHAGVMTHRECPLTEWCPLPYPSDQASYSIKKKDHSSYACTLFTGSKPGKGMVRVSIQGGDGYSFPANVLGGPIGSSGTAIVKGDFQENTKGKIIIRRLPDETANPKDVRIMCEKNS
jgi:hypothetical protein